MTTKQHASTTIVVNKKARFDFFVEDEYEAGLVLQGWEIKSLRAGKINISDAHIYVKNGEAWLLGAQINPLPTASTHMIPEPDRTRKLLLHRRELDRLIGLVERMGYTLIPLALYWSHNKIKVKIALAKGKKMHDKRETSKNRDWQRDHSRLMKRHQ
jgi:SsrA-binding protein